MNAQQRAVHDAIAKQLTDDGKLIEAGWQMMRALVIPPHISDARVEEQRKAFFLGAQHLYASILGVLDADDEPTAADLQRMEHIHNELEAFRMEVTSVHRPGRG